MTEVPALTREQLLERESEPAEIGRELERASSREGSLTVIEAAAGLGKTHLLEAVAPAPRTRRVRSWRREAPRRAGARVAAIDGPARLTAPRPAARGGPGAILSRRRAPRAAARPL